MARAAINRGTTAGDGTGETAFSAFGKVNDNFTELYTGFVGKDNVATTDPGVGNDGTQGYAAGSSWFNSTTGVMFSARSVATGAAVWVAVGVGNNTGMQVGRYYTPDGLSATAGGDNAIPNSIALHMIIFDQRFSCTTVGIRQVGNAGSGNCQLAIYANDRATFKPTGNAIVATGNSTTIANNPYDIVWASSATMTFEARTPYWAAFNTDNATNVNHATPNSRFFISEKSGTGSTENALFYNGIARGWAFAHTFGTWPDLTGAGVTMLTAGRNPATVYKTSAVFP